MEFIKYKNFILYTSIALFAVSLIQESYCTSQCGNSLMNLLFGWLGVLLELGFVADKYINPEARDRVLEPIGATFSWLANPALFLAWVTYKNNKNTSLFFAFIALILMVLFLLFDKIIDNEAGHYNEIVSYKAGYWLWLCSSIMLVAGIVTEKFKAPSTL